jgi:hypothetical protein
MGVDHPCEFCVQDNYNYDSLEHMIESTIDDGPCNKTIRKLIYERFIE